MKNYSIRIRLLTGMVLLLVVALIPPFYFFDDALRRDIMHEAQERALKGIDTVAWIMQEHSAFTSTEELDEWATQLGERMGMRISYIVGANVVADSNVAFEDIAAMDPHDTRPEVVTARQGETGLEIRYSTTLSKDLIYAAREMQAFDSLPSGVLRIAIPVSIAGERLSRLESGLLTVFLLTVLGTMLMGYLGTRPLLRSIDSLARTAQAIGQGQYGRRIRVYPGKEFKPLIDAINGMAHNIEQHLNMLVDQKGRLEAIFNGMTEGVMVLDANGKIHSFNRALNVMFPDLQSHCDDTPLEATMKPELQKAVDSLRDADVQAPQVIQLELAGERVLEVNLVPFVTPDGARRMVLVFHDISEREQLEKVRRDFVANVSHELKTPLTSIKGFAETLIESPPQNQEQIKAFLGTILKNANHMTKMVNSLLVLARSQHKGESTGLVPVDASEVLRSSIHDVQHLAKTKNIALENLLPETPIGVLGDKDGLLEVFRNLLDNAVKYSPPDSRVSISVRSIQGTTAFCVRDEGPGVPENARERIFERFYRIEHEGDTPHKDGSAGLGLAICRRIIKSHGGEIWVESPLNTEAGTGAAFFVTLKPSEDV